MSLRSSLLAAALAGLSMGAAHAQSSITYWADTGIEGQSYRQAVDQKLPIDNLFDTQGLFTLQGGPATASLSVVASPLSGMYKSYSRALVSGAAEPGSASAGSNFKLRDTITFNGPEPTVTVNFTLYWDTRVSGFDAASALRAVEGQYNPAMMFYATQNLVVHDGAAPGPAVGTCGTIDPFCETGGGVLTEPPPPTRQVYGWAFPRYEGDGTLFFGQGDGHYTGEQTLTFSVAAGSSLTIDYSAHNSVQCFSVTQCDLVVDSSHSDYLGLSVSAGASYQSAQGFQYQGLAAAVPEPGSWALALAGLAVLAARTRRRAR